MNAQVMEYFSQILYELTLAVGATLSLERETAAFMAWLERFLHPRLAVLFLADESHRVLRVAAASPPTPLPKEAMPMGVDPWAWLQEQDVPLPPGELPYRYAVPISAEGQILGILCMVSEAGPDDLAGEQQVVEAAAGYLAPILCNIRRYRTLEEQVAERTAALAQREAMFRALAEQSVAGVYLVTSERFLYVNRALADMFGYSVSELLEAYGPLDLVHPADRDLVTEMIRRRLRGEVEAVRYQFRGLRRDGSVIHVESHGRRIDYRGRPAILGVLIDISQRVQAEAAYRALVEHSLQGLIIIQDGRLVFANPAFLLGIGEREEEVVGHPLAEIMGKVYPEDRPRVQALLEAPASEEETSQLRRVNFRYWRSDGQLRWGRALVSRMTYRDRPAIQVAFLDITREQRSRELAARREAILHAVAEAAERFLARPEWEQDVEDLLARVGQAAGVSRVYIFQNHTGPEGALRTSQRFEWVAEGVTPQIDNPLLQDVGYSEAGFDRWEEVLSRGDLIVGHVKDFPPSEQALLRAQGILSILVAPIFVEDHFWGFIGFDACEEEREWTAAEISALRLVARLLGAAISRRMQEERLRLQSTALDAAANAVVITDREGTIRWVNPAFTQLTGYSAEEAIGQTPRILKSGKHDATFYRHLWETILAGKVWHGEIINRRRDGSLYTEEMTITPVRDARGNITHFIAIKQDITARKRAEEEVLRRHRLLEALNAIVLEATAMRDLETLASLVTNRVLSALDAPIGTIWMDVNLPALHMVRYSKGLPENIQKEIGDKILEMSERHHLPRGGRLIIDDMAAVKGMWKPLAQMLLAYGIRATLAMPITGEEKVMGEVIVADVRPRRWREEEIALLEAVGRQVGVAAERLRLIAELEEALRAKDEMIQDVSHELRTPLTMILGYTELLQDGTMGALNEDQARAIEVIHRNGQRLRFMVDRLLLMRTLSPESLEKVHFEVAPWLQDVQTRWHPEFQDKGMRLEVQVMGDVPPLVADRHLMDEVMDNLLHNAIKFSPQGGTVRVRTWAEGETVYIAVSDEGVGIPPDKLERIFERFYQVSQGPSRRFEGMGIGLALCKEIVELHGGRLWAESEGEGKGSTFYISLPTHV